MKLRVDPAACDGFGFCAELLADLVILDEWGYPLITEDEVPSHRVSLARQAVKFCPRRALQLEPND